MNNINHYNILHNYHKLIFYLEQDLDDSEQNRGDSEHILAEAPLNSLI